MPKKPRKAEPLQVPVGGRPKLSDEERREERLIVRLNEAELAAAKQLAAAAGIPLAIYARRRVLKLQD
jgi:predicted DNA binding CopG/RHH family protein